MATTNDRLFNKINAVLAEIERFQDRAVAARDRLLRDPMAITGSRETGALYRASLDLSAALVALRRRPGR